VGALEHRHESPLDVDPTLTPAQVVRMIEDQRRGDDGAPLHFCGVDRDGDFRDTARNEYFYHGPHDGLRLRGIADYHFD